MLYHKPSEALTNEKSSSRTTYVWQIVFLARKVGNIYCRKKNCFAFCFSYTFLFLSVCVCQCANGLIVEINNVSTTVLPGLRSRDRVGGGTGVDFSLPSSPLFAVKNKQLDSCSSAVTEQWIICESDVRGQIIGCQITCNPQKFSFSLSLSPPGN